MLCYALLYAMLCYAMLYAMLFYAMLCYAMLCYAMLCYAMLCYAMLCYAMLWPRARPLKCKSHDGFARRIVWSLMQNETRKWPVVKFY